MYLYEFVFHKTGINPIRWRIHGFCLRIYTYTYRNRMKQIMIRRVSTISLNVFLLRPIEELYAGGPSICLETQGIISPLRSLKNSCAIWLVAWNINHPRLLRMNLRHQNHHQNQKALLTLILIDIPWFAKSTQSEESQPWNDTTWYCRIDIPLAKFRTFSQALETELKDTTLGSQPKKRLELRCNLSKSFAQRVKVQKCNVQTRSGLVTAHFVRLDVFEAITRNNPQASSA